MHGEDVEFLANQPIDNTIGALNHFANQWIGYFRNDPS